MSNLLWESFTLSGALFGSSAGSFCHPWLVLVEPPFGAASALHPTIFIAA
jgi:hypothetical protein